MSKMSDKLTMIEDPTERHVMPPPLPQSRPQKQQQSRHITKKVLDEDDYVGALEAIIERDYFPDSKKLQQQLDLLDAYEKRNPRLLREVHRQILSEQRKFGSTPTPSPVDPATTPLFVSNSSSSSRGPANSSRGAAVAAATIGESEHLEDTISTIVKESGGIDEFMRKYTSEDNASFDELHEKDIQARRRKFHWAYEAITDGSSETESKSKQKPGMLMLYYMGNKVLTAKEREKFDQILDGSDDPLIGDERSSGPNLWKFRVRNQMFFPPELPDSRDTCLMTGVSPAERGLPMLPPSISTERGLPPSTSTSAAGTALKILQDENSTSTSTALVAAQSSPTSSSSSTQATTAPATSAVIISTSTNKWVANSAVRAEKLIQRRNTNLRGSFLQEQGAVAMRPSGITPSPLEAPHTPSVMSDAGGSQASSGENDFYEGGKRDYGLVQMTPSPMPGNDPSDSPIMTWGEVCGTPLILDPAEQRRTGIMAPSATASLYGGSGGGGGASDSSLQYFPPPTPTRDLLARSLDSRGKLRVTAAGAASSVPSSSSASSTHHRTHGTPLTSTAAGASRTPLAATATALSRGSGRGGGDTTPFGGMLSSNNLPSSSKRRRSSEHGAGLSRGSSNSDMGTGYGGGSKLKQMTPAAQALAARIANGSLR